MRAYLLMACILCAAKATAEDGEGKLNATEINSIRAVSQAILKVRGQHRQRIDQEIIPLRNDIDGVKSVLAEAVAEQNTVIGLTKPNANAAPPVAIEDAGTSAWTALMGRATKLWQKKDGWIESIRQRSPEKIESRYDNSLKRARLIVASRRAKIETQLPAFWQLGKTPDPDRQRAKDALVVLEAELHSIENEQPGAKHEKIINTISRLDLEKPTEQHEPAPTITSITKHVSE